jgi:hypothetical protein
MTFIYFVSMRFVGFGAVSKKFAAIWNVTPCSLLDIY